MDMKIYLLITLIFTASACIQNSNTGNQNTDDIAAINELREKEREAALAGNMDSLMALRTDDFIAMLPDMPAVSGKEAVREVLTEMFGQMKEFEHNTVSEEITVLGDWAFQRGTFTDWVVLESGGDTLAYEGKFLWILQRQEDGIWKYVIQMSNKNGSVSESS